MRLKVRIFNIAVALISVFITNSEAACLDRPQLFIHKKDVVREVLGSENYITLTDLNKEFLTCRSSQNLEWHYVGKGEPSKLQEFASIQINSVTEDGSREYCMTSRISFYPKQSDTELSKHTGKYICQEIGNSSNAASTYVFVGRRSAPAFLQSRKTIQLPLGPDNITESSFYIPCVTSTPSVNASLLRKPVGSSKFKLISSSSDLERLDTSSKSPSVPKAGPVAPVPVFDPRYGFRVPVPSVQNLSSFYGEYKCVGKIGFGSTGKRNNENVDEDFVIYSLAIPPTLRVFPAERTVFTSTILNLTCESTEEPVILKEVKIRPSTVDQYAYDDHSDGEDDDVDSNSVEDDILETVEKTEQKLHVANYLEMNPVPGSFGEFQCLAEKDKRVLHSWQYRVLGKKEEKLSGIKFNKRDNSFSCRTKSGMPGKLSFVSCRTPTECRINSICLQNSETCRGYSNATKALCHRGNNFCGKIFYKGGSGLIRCIGEGIDQIRGFTDEANDQRLRMGFHKLKPSETAFLKVTSPSVNTRGESKSQFEEGEEIQLSLRLGHYYFLQPVQWAIKFRNGSSEHITPGSQNLQKTKLYRTIQTKLKLPNNLGDSGSQIVGINALIPLRSSVPPSWKTITLPITVSGPTLEATPEVSGESRLALEQVDIEVGPRPTGRSEIQFEEVTENNSVIDQNTEAEFVTVSLDEESLHEDFQDDVTTERYNQET